MRTKHESSCGTKDMNDGQWPASFIVSHFMPLLVSKQM